MVQFLLTLCALFLIGGNLLGSEPEKLPKDPLPAEAVARLGSLDVWSGAVDAIAFTPDGATLAVAIGSRLRFWDVASRKPVRELRVQASRVQEMAYSPDGKLLVTYPARDRKPRPVEPFKKPRIDDDEPPQALTPLGIAVWNARTGAALRVLDGEGEFAFSVDGKRLATRELDRWYDTTTWDRVALPGGGALAANAGRVTARASFSPDGSFLAAYRNDAVYLLHLSSGKLQRFPVQKTPRVHALHFLPGGKEMLLVGDPFRGLDLADGSLRIMADAMGADAVAVSPRAPIVAWAGWRRDVELADVANGRRARLSGGHISTAGPMAFSPDGKLLASGSRDGTVVLWLVDSVKLLTPKAFERAERMRRHAKPPVPPGARVHLRFDKKEYILGEDIKAEFIVENTGTRLFALSVDSNYQVTARDRQGRAVADPDAHGWRWGGLGWYGETDLAPGEKYAEKLSLVSYLRFVEAGTYEVRVCHDLGWLLANERHEPPMFADDGTPILALDKVPTAEEWRKQREEGLRRHPVAVGTVTIVRPTPEQARRRVEELYRKQDPKYELQRLRAPEYLPLLMERAELGDGWALYGIEGIATPEATRALLCLADIALNKFEDMVLERLLERLPDPGLDAGRPKWMRTSLSVAQRRYLVRHAWRAELADDLRKLAQRLRDRTNILRREQAAYMLECLSEKRETP